MLNNLINRWIWFSRVLMIGGGLVFGLLLLEIAVRLLPPSQGHFIDYGNMYTCSPTLGWQGKPNHQMLFKTDEYTQHVRRNSEGMHDTEHDLIKTEDTFRILLIGDSFVDAFQVSDAEMSHQVLENLLNQRLTGFEKSFELLNAGIISWSTAQELIYYRQRGKKYNPDLVLLYLFIGDDIRDNLPGDALTLDGINCFSPYFPLCNGELDPEPWSFVPGIEPAWGECSSLNKWVVTVLSKLRYNSQLLTRLDAFLISDQERRIFGREFTKSFIPLYLPEETEEVRYGWQVTEALLTQFNRDVQANGSKFAVVLVSPREVVWLSQFDQGQLQVLQQTDPYLAQAEIDRPNRRLMNFLRSQNIPALDLQPIMIERTTQIGRELFFPVDRHWTAEGNRLVAETIFQWLLASELLPFDPEVN